MVCLGNICRSPLAEGILASKLPKAGFFIDSAGTGDYHIGAKPDRRSIEVASKHGIDISKQRCRQLTADDLENYDLIYAMDKSNLENIHRLAQTDEQKQKARLILPAAGSPLEEVPDPYYGSLKDFETVFSILDEACKTLAEKLIAQRK